MQDFNTKSINPLHDEVCYNQSNLYFRGAGGIKRTQEKNASIAFHLLLNVFLFNVFLIRSIVRLVCLSVILPQHSQNGSEHRQYLSKKPKSPDTL